MELFEEILSKRFVEELNANSANLKINAVGIVKTECYKALKRIKTIIENDSLLDFDCIEEIVRAFESIGSNGGTRHDFG